MNTYLNILASHVFDESVRKILQCIKHYDALYTINHTTPSTEAILIVDYLVIKKFLRGNIDSMDYNLLKELPESISIQDLRSVFCEDFFREQILATFREHPQLQTHNEILRNNPLFGNSCAILRYRGIDTSLVQESYDAICALLQEGILKSRVRQENTKYILASHYEPFITKFSHDGRKITGIGEGGAGRECIFEKITDVIMQVESLASATFVEISANFKISDRYYMSLVVENTKHGKKSIFVIYNYTNTGEMVHISFSQNIQHNPGHIVYSKGVLSRLSDRELLLLQKHHFPTTGEGIDLL